MRLWFLTTNATKTCPAPATATAGSSPSSSPPPPSAAQPQPHPRTPAAAGGDEKKEPPGGAAAVAAVAVVQLDDGEFVDVELGLGPQPQQQRPSCTVVVTPATTAVISSRWLRGALLAAGVLSVAVVLCGTGYLIWLLYMITKQVLELINHHSG